MNHDNPKIGRVLVVAGSDSGGGAGIQGDIKTITMLGGYAATAVTALTAQNTHGVFSIVDITPAFVAEQMRVVLEDIGADCIKTGMLHNSAIIYAVADVLADYPEIPLVLDPVMIAKGGAPLLEPEAVEALKTLLIPRAALITPNLPEAEILVGCKSPVISSQYMEELGQKLLELGPKAVLLKGGHMPGEELMDILLYYHHERYIERFTSLRIETRHTHGTGCTLASAIATGIAQGLELGPAVERAHAYVQQAIANAPGLGGGHGPLGHAFALTS